MAEQRFGVDWRDGSFPDVGKTMVCLGRALLYRPEDAQAGAIATPSQFRGECYGTFPPRANEASALDVYGIECVW